MATTIDVGIFEHPLVAFLNGFSTREIVLTSFPLLRSKNINSLKKIDLGLFM